MPVTRIPTGLTAAPAPSPAFGLLAPFAVLVGLALRRLTGASPGAEPAAPSAAARATAVAVEPAPAAPGRAMAGPARTAAPGPARAFGSGAAAQAAAPAVPALAGGQVDECPSTISRLAGTLIGHLVKVFIRGQDDPVVGTIASLSGELLVLAHHDRITWIDLAKATAIRSVPAHRDDDHDGGKSGYSHCSEDDEELDDPDDDEEMDGGRKRRTRGFRPAYWDPPVVGGESPATGEETAAALAGAAEGDGEVPMIGAPQPEPAVAAAVATEDRAEPERCKARVLWPPHWRLLSTWRPRCV